MKRIQYFLIILLGLFVHAVVQGELIREEQFIGYSSGTLGDGALRGTLNGWNLTSDQVTLTEGSGSLIATNLGVVESAGDRAFTTALATNSSGNPIGARNQLVPGGTFPSGTLAVNTNLYYSFLYKFNNAADVSVDGEYIIQVNRANSGINTPQHWDLVAKNVAGQIQLGIAKAGAPNNNTNFASALINVGETVFVVVRQQIITDPQTDIYDLWINPPAASLATNEANIPIPDASVGALPSDGAEDTSNTGPGRFVVFSGANAEFDELRFGTSWADVTPYLGQCLPAGVTVQPVSVTQSAELAATFSITARGTSRTVQWQVSTNAGASFADISGAVSTLYRTPNLTLAESGNQYRAIVSVPCNSSSVTSAVATVTLTAPTETAVGTVMFDTFLDPDLGFDDRANMPVTPSNSVWYTAVTDNLTAFGQGGNMLGLPLSASSSLWLGYFINTNDLPVHLAIGRSIKVRLPFTVGDFASFTGNGSVRCGLFDYYDGGTRLTVDGPAAGGSQGNGTGVRGYMVNIQFGTNFNDTTPLELFGRSILTDNNLIGTTGSYDSLGSGPVGGVDTNAPAFVTGTEYTLEFIVTRTAFSSVNITASIITPSTNWTVTATDNNFAYHRFDAFGVRPNNLEGTSTSFTFPEFEVKVEQSVLTVPPFSITSVQRLAPDSVKITWDSVSGATYHVLSRDTLTGAVSTNATVVATGSSTSYTNAPIPGAVTQRYYQVVAPPYTP